MRQRADGFTLIELLIVIAIIGVIAGIALPVLSRARIKANETNAEGAMSSLVTGIRSYEEDYGICPPLLCCSMIPRPAGCFPCPEPPTCPSPPCPIPSPVPLAYLQPKQIESLGPAKPWDGYVFRYETGAPVGAGTASFCYQATPLIKDITGVRTFATDQTGTVVVSSDGSNCCTGGGQLSPACTPLR